MRKITKDAYVSLLTDIDEMSECATLLLEQDTYLEALRVNTGTSLHLVAYVARLTQKTYDATEAQTISVDSPRTYYELDSEHDLDSLITATLASRRFEGQMRAQG